MEDRKERPLSGSQSNFPIKAASEVINTWNIEKENNPKNVIQ